MIIYNFNIYIYITYEYIDIKCYETSAMNILHVYRNISKVIMNFRYFVLSQHGRPQRNASSFASNNYLPVCERFFFESNGIFGERQLHWATVY